MSADDSIYRPTPRVVSPYPLGTSFALGEELPVRARDDLDPISPPLEYADGRLSWDGLPTRGARNRARLAAREAEHESAREARIREMDARASARQRSIAALVESVRNCAGHALVGQSGARPFSGPVAREPNPSAHGNVVATELCRCGATRHVAINGAHREEGPWTTDLDDRNAARAEVQL